MNKKGKLIVIDGLDGSGKATQASKLYKKLKKMGYNALTFSFPDYDSPGCTLVKMYLNGELSENPTDINGYAASTFFAVDRYASYMQHWKKDYEDGAIIILDRYTTSNATHQMVKLPEDKWESFLKWLFDFEYNKLGIPAPDAVIYLDMLPEVSQKLLDMRYHGDESKKDIHEKNIGYIKACRPVALYTAKKQDWNVIRCDDSEKPFSVDAISKKVYKIVKEKILNG